MSKPIRLALVAFLCGGNVGLMAALIDQHHWFALVCFLSALISAREVAKLCAQLEHDTVTR